MMQIRRVALLTFCFLFTVCFSGALPSGVPAGRSIDAILATKRVLEGFSTRTGARTTAQALPFLAAAQGADLLSLDATDAMASQEGTVTIV